MIYEFIHLFISLVVILAVPSLRRFFFPTPVATHPTEESSPVNRAGRDQFFDVVKGVAILAVILIHVTWILQFSAGLQSTLLFVANNLLLFAIPFFLISSGALLSAPVWRPGWFVRFYGRRLLAVGLPYAIVVAGLGLYQSLALGEIILSGLLGTAALPFYFVALLFQLYFVYPFVYRLAQKRWFVWTTLGISLVSYFTPEFRWAGELVLFTSYLFFFVWGMHLSEPLRRGTLRVDWLAGIVIVGVFLFAQAVIGVERFYNGQYFYGIAAFWLLFHTYHAGRMSQAVRSGLAYLGERSLWIFLMHFGVLVLLFPFLQQTVSAPAGLLVSFTLLGTVGSVAVGLMCDIAYRAIGSLMNKNRLSKA